MRAGWSNPSLEASGRDSIRTATGLTMKAGGTPYQGETLDEHCAHGWLADELTKAEFEQMTNTYQSNASVDAISGSLGPLYYATVNVASIPVEAVVDPGSSATIISFDLFKKVGHKASIPKEALKPSDLVLRDYSQRPIPIGARVNMMSEWQERSVKAMDLLAI